MNTGLKTIALSVVAAATLVGAAGRQGPDQLFAVDDSIEEVLGHGGKDACEADDIDFVIC